MAPPSKLKTYSRGNNSTINCFDALNILFAKNLAARKLGGKVRKQKTKVHVKELSEKVKSVFSDESSLHVNVNDTFDKLLKGSARSNSKKSDNLSVHILSNNVTSSVIQHNSIENASVLSKLRSYSNISNTDTKDLSNNTLSWFNHPTKSGERITNELEIEKNSKTKKKTKITKNNSRDSPISLRSKGELSTEKEVFFGKENGICYDGNISHSFNPIFTNSVREQIMVHCSTPLVPTKRKIVIKQPISPIDIADENSENFMEESLEEIKSWDTSLNVEGKVNKKLDNSLDQMEELVGFNGESIVTSKTKKEQDANFSIKTLQTIQDCCTSNKDLFTNDMSCYVSLKLKSLDDLQTNYLSFCCNNKSLNFNFVTNRRKFRKPAPYKSPLMHSNLNKLDDRFNLSKSLIIVLDNVSLNNSKIRNSCLDLFTTPNSLLQKCSPNDEDHNNCGNIEAREKVEVRSTEGEEIAPLSDTEKHQKTSENQSNIGNQLQVLQEVEINPSSRKSECAVPPNNMKNKSMELQSPKTWIRSRYYQKKGLIIDLTESLPETGQSDVEQAQDQPIMKDIVVNLTLNRFSSLVNEDSECQSPVNSTIDVSDDEIVNSSLSTPMKVNFCIPLVPLEKLRNNVSFKTGKNWRRSLCQQKKDGVIDLTESPRPGALTNPRNSIKIIPAKSERYSRRKTTLQNYAENNLSMVLDENYDDAVSSRTSKISLRSSPTVTAREVVLQRCNQMDPVPFDDLYSNHVLNNCKKIGEGVYGEVFLYYSPQHDTSTVVKIIPIEGETIVNGEKQKKFHEIISEVVIASELSNLRKNRLNKCSGFCEVQRIACVRGRYPKTFTDLWHEYDRRKGSENDSPEMFDDDQLYIVLSLAHAGQDIESFVFNNATCAVSMFKQVACSLATAEEVLKFEHRDLHWGNVLVRASTDKNKKILYKHKGKEREVLANGVEATVIDFTLSRIEHQGVVIFNDLGLDPDLFVAEGDYQFDVYRLMKQKNNNDWRKFEPYSNVLWLHYILRKSIKDLRYKNINTKIHKKGIEELKVMEADILNYGSASEFILSLE